MYITHKQLVFGGKKLFQINTLFLYHQIIKVIKNASIGDKNWTVRINGL